MIDFSQSSEWDGMNFLSQGIFFSAFDEKYSFTSCKISATLRSQESDWLVAKSSQNMVQQTIFFKNLDWAARRP
jgi:hypothetical protein